MISKECKERKEKMGQISIRLTNEKEVELRKKAMAEKKSLAEYCRKKILSGKEEEEELSRPSIEMEIDKLRMSIEKSNKNMLNLAKHLLRQARLNGELSYGVLDIASDDNEKKAKEAEEAERAADEFIRQIFAGEKV